MSDSPELDIREHIVRIDRMIAETEKFQSEQRKLIAEGEKFRREPWIALVTSAAAFLAAGAAIGGLVVKVFAS